MNLRLCAKGTSDSAHSEGQKRGLDHDSAAVVVVFVIIIVLVIVVIIIVIVFL